MARAADAPIRTNSRWTQVDDDRLRSMYPDPIVPLSSLAAVLGRTVAAVRARAADLDLRRRERPVAQALAADPTGGDGLPPQDLLFDEMVQARSLVVRSFDDGGVITPPTFHAICQHFDRADEILIGSLC